MLYNPAQNTVSVKEHSGRQSRHRAGWLLLFALFPLLSLGCGNGLSSLNGTVTVDGKPAPAGISLSFSPVDAGGSPSYATTDGQGRYEAAFTFQEKGIQPGRIRVQLVPGGEGSTSMPEIKDGKPVVKPENKRPQFPKEYYQEIMIITVAEGANTIEIPLSTQVK